jgi:hypothetical protein
MRRAVALAAIAVLGVLVGAGVTLAAQAREGGAAGDDATAAGSGPAEVSDPAPSPTSTASADDPTSARAEPIGAHPPTVLAWTANGLDPALATRVTTLAEVGRSTVVAGDLVTTPAPDAPGGMVLGLDAIAIDPATYPPFAERPDRGALRRLEPGDAVVGATSADVHSWSPGDNVALTNGATLRIAAVVADASVGAAELVVPTTGAAAAGIDTGRYVLVRPRGTADATAAAIRSVADPARPPRLRIEGETPYLRSSDAVLPQSRIKAAFGEFAYVPPTSGREITQDPRWTADEIVSAEVPVLGRVSCHRALVPALRGALRELADRNLAGLIQSYDGCYNPRLVTEGGSISRHAWGAAIDLNFSGNRTGTASIQDPRLIEVMGRWGFASGDGWLVPDPGHFEYIGPPRP